MQFCCNTLPNTTAHWHSYSPPSTSHLYKPYTPHLSTPIHTPTIPSTPLHIPSHRSHHYTPLHNLQITSHSSTSLYPHHPIHTLRHLSTPLHTPPHPAYSSTPCTPLYPPPEPLASPPSPSGTRACSPGMFSLPVMAVQPSIAWAVKVFYYVVTLQK